MEKKRVTGRLLYLVMGIFAFNGAMDLYLWFSKSFMVPSFTVSGFTFAFILILYVLKKYIT